ncbi:mannose-1-phosphate guanylyltransferase/mannose-6-phosphate isomerase [Enterobacter cloacae subsp. dissolvens]|uniref:mannose-1-phosphate guanylyltransferase/mannose-6-phosphate isomerase n=1 Tax=Enterobacter cloacae TaxID=550 RepID=UPI0007B3EABE|nr:mannose-1-phosphate guanylyltransferase/mannose-6-phosphate isomerase [Enterobacter cloacae]KZP67946.1 mannose-1-phosphate guanylyltransferase/mannose-6-phosphate isomerase [Enterobacter cloacae subsp. dissolvens]MEA5213924.1 mannose-1-phosphate guanylyltransferase/mannose-6-phosphate isomerase [Enterobacter cloacae]RXX45928.1 mannose-1-phosphate guanylyltransferase/mannose-6-phosphate isomerase [Enterobacter cloacae]
MDSFKPIILAGGSGTRLWPLSRTQRPKQFLKLLDARRSLFQQTLLRLDGMDIQEPQIICNEEHRFLVNQQLKEIGHEKATILLETVGRNTAPAIAVAALDALSKGEDPLLLVLAADHFIENIPSFHNAIKKAIYLAEKNYLVTFGIIPSCPNTGYGYIKYGEEISGSHFIESFKEKPSYETACCYVDSGNYYWNSGMFMFRASVFVNELNKYAPNILQYCSEAVSNSKVDESFLRIDDEFFSRNPSLSVDYAVMEHTNIGVVVSMDAGWSDVGSWSALWQLGEKNESGNCSDANVISIDCKNNYIKTDSTLVATIGVDNLVVVCTKDAVLISHRNKDQDVKLVVDELKSQQREEYRQYPLNYRRWGSHERLDSGQRFQVNRITINKGSLISKQYHLHRAEHWVIVSGKAEVILNEVSKIHEANESIYIPPGCVHTIRNVGDCPLEIIEIQSGDYLGEDDITRVDTGKEL